MGLRNKDLISIHDLEVGDVATILDVAKKIKTQTEKRRASPVFKRQDSGDVVLQGFYPHQNFF